MVLLNAQVYVLGWNVYLANFFAIVLVSIWNFLLNLKFGWDCSLAGLPGKSWKASLRKPAWRSPD